MIETHGSSVIETAGRLADGNGAEKLKSCRIGRARLRREGEGRAALPLDHHLTGSPRRSCGDLQVLHRAAKADIEVMVVRIDHRCAPGKVRQDRNGLPTLAKQPGLGIVAVGGKGSVADQIPGRRLRFGRFPQLGGIGGIVAARQPHRQDRAHPASSQDRRSTCQYPTPCQHWPSPEYPQASIEWQDDTALTAINCIDE